MNAPGLRKITGERYESECGEYAILRSGKPFRGGGRAWIVTRKHRVLGRVRNLRDGQRKIDADKTRRATEILTLGVEVPF